MQNMILEALQLTLNNALDGSSALEAEIQNYPELLKVPCTVPHFISCYRLDVNATLEEIEADYSDGGG